VQRVEKGLQYAYAGRKMKKRNMRSMWIQRVNAGARQHGTSYSELIFGLDQAGVSLNRKVLSELAANEPYSFRAVVETSKMFQADKMAEQRD
jgi:large subunit ribosomal protein L20